MPVPGNVLWLVAIERLFPVSLRATSKVEPCPQALLPAEQAVRVPCHMLPESVGPPQDHRLV